GRTVVVWTSDSYANYYRIFKVRVTTNVMAGVTSLTRERLWLQTSTGPNTTYPKLVVEASRYKTVKTTYAASHPTPHPISCGRGHGAQTSAEAVPPTTSPRSPRVKPPAMRTRPSDRSVAVWSAR